MSFTINADSQIYKQTIKFMFLCGAISADRELSMKKTRRFQRAWECFQRHKMEIYDRPATRLRWKVELLKAEVIETLVYCLHDGEPEKPDYDRLRRIHHPVFL